MPIFVGDKEILAGDLKIGDQDIQEVYVGDQKIWPAGTPPPQIIHFATLNLIAGGSQTIYVTAFNLEGVYLMLQDGSRVDIPLDAHEYPVTVGNGNTATSAEVYFPNENVFPDSYINFHEYGLTVSMMHNAIIHDFGNLKSLYWLFYGCENLTSVTVDDTRHVIEDMGAAFGLTHLTSIVSMGYTEVLTSSSLYKATYLTGDIYISLPKTTVVAYMFDFEGGDSSGLSSLRLNAPSATDWKKTFNEVQADVIQCTIESVADDLQETFRFCICPCIFGVIDSTNASTTASMFSSSHINKPDATTQGQIEAGMRWENDICP